MIDNHDHGPTKMSFSMRSSAGIGGATPNERMRAVRRVTCWVRTLAAFAATMALAGACVVYSPVPAYPSTYDRAWNAALGALDDAGVRVTSADAASGVIRGARGDIDVSVTVTRLTDGRTKVQFDSKDTQRDPTLADRFSQAYERRMGR